MSNNIKRATLTDVAKKAKVSIKTASRVVRQEPNVKPATRQLVEAVIKELDYRPTSAARSSVGARSYMIGLLFDNPNPSYTSEMIRGVLLETRAQSYHLVVEPIDAKESDVADKVKRFVVQSNLDGVILPPPLSDREDILEALQSLDKPCARLAPSDPGEDGITVTMDDRQAAREMTDYLISLGHRDIAFVSGRAGTATTERRLGGFRDAMAGANLTVNEDWVRSAGYEYHLALDAGEGILSGANRPTAIFAANDDMAAGVIAACYKLGLSVPGDVSVAGFDDSVIATVVWPQLTTVRQPIQEMASLAVQQLIATARGTRDVENDQKRVLSELIVRDSTGRAYLAANVAE